jgi:Ca2+-binding EF-hand superfamily protein
MPLESSNDMSAKMSDFRATLRVYAVESSSEVRAILMKILGGDESILSTHTISITKFCDLMNGIRSVRQKFTPNDLNDIYNESVLDIGMENMNPVNMVEYFARTISTARGIAMKLRKAILEDYPDGIADYNRAFQSMVISGGNTVDLDSLTDFAEEVLDMKEGTISDKEAKELYTFVDRNGDGVVSNDDFIEYILGQGADAVRRLHVSNDDVVVSIQVSNTVAQEAELKKVGYVQLHTDLSNMAGITLAQHGSFGNGQSMWIWRAKQGTCSGRLKPVTDIRLEGVSMSSDLVLLGYRCLPTSIAGQWVWVKHANSAEEVKDGIVDFRISLGRSKIASDKIWTSPGVGWNHAEGNFNKTMFGSSDAFLWFRPLRPRTNNWEHSVGTMTDESRQARILRALRTAVRNYIPLNIIPSCAFKGAVSGTGKEDINQEYGNNSDVGFDFTNLFVMYCANNSMTLRNFRLLLADVGCHLDRPDEQKCYNHIDSDLHGGIQRKEYASFMVMTDYELDCHIDEIREQLLKQHVTNLGKNPLRQSRVLSHIFKHFNVTRDKVLSQSEFSSMCSTLQIFLVSEELSKIMKLMDCDKDGRLEEQDFLRFLKSDSNAMTRKAHRVHEAAAYLRRWLSRGSTRGSNKKVEGVIATQWAELKKRCEKISNKAFSGYLSTQDLQNILAHQGLHLSFLEVSELALVIAPHRNARIHENDLEAFMKGGCRSIGELVAIVERDTMRAVIDLYRNHRNVMNSDGVADETLKQAYQGAMQDILSRVMASQRNGASNAEWEGVNAAASKAARSSSPEVVSIAQLKAGIEASMGRPPNSPLPNLEEWSILAILVGGSIAQDDLFGTNAKKFIEGMCTYSAGKLGSLGENDSVSLDALCSQLRIMIKDEALVLGGGKNPDYLAVFNTFDQDGGGTISLEEFSSMLVKLQLIDRLPKRQIPQLLRSFDTSNKGSITYEDFLRFAESGREEDDDIALDDDDEADGFLGLGSNTPPTSMTHNSECDWLLWFVWRQACRTSHRDPEAAVNDLEASCQQVVDNGSVSNDGQYHGISSDILWRKLSEFRLQGSMTRSQYESGIHFVSMDGSGRADDPIDFKSLCRYVIRMGRAYNGLVQERRNVDSRKFSQAFASLQKQLIIMDSTRQLENNSGNSATSYSINTSYFERVLRRQDSNQDGLLTVPEFKLGLRRMQIRDERQWSKAMVRKLFEETDNRSDGLLSIAEFGNIVRGDYSRDAQKTDELSDDEDNKIFSAQRHTPDAALQKKVSGILMDLVPLSGQNGSPNSISTHCDAVRSAIYKFFSRYDPANNGLIAEEHFHVFVRKSGLQSRLRGGELRRLVGKLRVRGAGREAASVDYEKLCRMISPNSDSVPRARVDALMLQLQEAAHASSLADRSFLNLCTLADPRFTGMITVDEVCIVAKMMGCPLTVSEVDMIRELQRNEDGGGDVGHRSNLAGKSSRMIDYRRLNHLISTYVPGATPSISTAYGESKAGGAASVFRVRSHEGALPAYATPSGVTRIPQSPSATISLNQMRGLHTPGAPGGSYLQTQTPSALSSFGSSVRIGMGVTGGDFGVTPTRYAPSRVDYGLSSLMNRVQNSNGQWQDSASVFARHCAEADGSGAGLLSESALQSIFDNLRVPLTPADLNVVRSRFASHDGRIEYKALCRSLQSSTNNGTGFSGVLSSPAVTKRISGLRNEGVNIQEAFRDADESGSGTMEVRRFSDMLLRMGLVQTERQLCLAIDEYACLSDRNRVNYLDFLSAMENAENSQKRIEDSRNTDSRLWDASPMTTIHHTTGRQTVMGSGYDGFTNRSVGSNEGDSMLPPLGRDGWNDEDSVRSEYDSLIPHGGIALGRNVAVGASGPLGSWTCHVCNHSGNSLDVQKCNVCDSTQISSNQIDEKLCSNCKYTNDIDAKSCKMCELRLQ